MLNQKGIILPPLLVWTVIIAGSILIAQDAVKKGYISLPSSDQVTNVSETPSPEPTIILTPIPQQTWSPYVDPDPIEPCTSKFSGDSINVRRSECVSKYSDCGLNGNTEYKVILKTECDKKHAEENARNISNNRASNTLPSYPPCTVYYPALGYSITYNYTSPSDCSYWQERAKVAKQPLSLPKIEAAPLPSMDPYKPSEEWVDTVDKFNQEVSKPWAPTQFTAPSQKCYATWDEYFNAHPNYAPQNIKGMSGTPPCD